MVYRGYLMNRVADLMNRTRSAWIVSLIVVHVGFGLAHAYQGVTGVLDEGLAGLLLGLIYLRTGLHPDLLRKVSWHALGKLTAKHAVADDPRLHKGAY